MTTTEDSQSLLRTEVVKALEPDITELADSLLDEVAGETS
jgi:hypothetical protein